MRMYTDNGKMSFFHRPVIARSLSNEAIPMQKCHCETALFLLSSLRGAAATKQSIQEKMLK